MIDYTTFTEEDPGSHITVAANTITFAGLVTTEEACVWKDMGAGGINDDFVHTFTFTPSSFSSHPYVTIWGVSNSPSVAFATASTMSCQTLAIVWDQSACGFYLMEQNGLPTTMSFNYLDYDMPATTSYTYRVSRDQTTGTYGTLTLEMFVNPTDSVPAYSQTLTLSAKVDYQYMYVLSTGYSLVSGTLAGTTKNMSLAIDPDCLTRVVSDVREILNEINEGFWLNSELQSWAYDAVVDIAVRTQCIPTTTVVSTASGTKSYSLSSIETKYAVYGNVGLRKTIEKQDGHDFYPDRTPNKWWQRQSLVGFEPLPDGIYAVSMYIADSPTVWTSPFAVPPVRGEFRNLIILYMLICAYIKDGKMKVASHLYDVYIADIKDLTTIYTEEDIDPRSDYLPPELIQVKEVENAQSGR